MTLLHYIIAVLEKDFPSVASFSQELHNVPDAAKIKYVLKYRETSSTCSKSIYQSWRRAPPPPSLSLTRSITHDAMNAA